MNALPPTQPTTKSGIDAGLAFHQPMLASPDPQAMLPSERIAANSGATVTVKISGTGNLTFVQAPKLPLPTSFEQYAAAWLEEHGWTTLSRNWHTRYGELDIVMLNPEYTVVFVEVKSRRSMHYGYPQEAITPAKQHNLRKAACDWLLDRRNRVPHSAVRFDVVTIVLRVGRPLVHHIENAF
ncbi:MAG: YraN family protein [Alistipes onderdonkii]|nr:YraN family protein [Alistipes onderdonkii]